MYLSIIYPFFIDQLLYYNKHYVTNVITDNIDNIKSKSANHPKIFTFVSFWYFFAKQIDLIFRSPMFIKVKYVLGLKVTCLLFELKFNYLCEWCSQCNNFQIFVLYLFHRPFFIKYEFLLLIVHSGNKIWKDIFVFAW